MADPESWKGDWKGGPVPGTVQPFAHHLGIDPAAKKVLDSVGAAAGPTVKMVPRFLVVGKEPVGGFVPDFPTIWQAMETIPWVDPGHSDDYYTTHPKPAKPHSFGDPWTILVLPGFYVEWVTMRPFVNLVGLYLGGVIIIPPDWPDRWDGIVDPYDDKFRFANVYLNSCSTLTNLYLGDWPNPRRYVNGKPERAAESVFIWGQDRCKRPDGTYGGYGGDVYGCGATNVWLFPFSETPDHAPETGTAKRDDPFRKLWHSRTRAIRMCGRWHTSLWTNIGASCYAREGFALELIGTGRNKADGLLADCHFMDSFIDDFFVSGHDPTPARPLPTTPPPPSGGILVKDVFDVHFRDALDLATESRPPPYPPSYNILRLERALNTPEIYMKTEAHLEGMTMVHGAGPKSRSALHVGERCDCFLSHSYIRSKSGTGRAHILNCLAEDTVITGEILE